MSNLRQIAREAARGAERDWWTFTTSEEPCEHWEYLADAVAMAVLEYLRDAANERGGLYRLDFIEALKQIGSGNQESPRHSDATRRSEAP